MSLSKDLKRRQRHVRIRAKVSGTATHPRLCIFRSSRAIYAQLVDDTKGHILASTSTLKMKKGKPVELAKSAGLEIAKLAKAKKIESCTFDRGGYLYHGRVKALAEGAREGGLKF